MKGTVSPLFRAIRPKLCRNFAFRQNFHSRKLGEITIFYAVNNLELSRIGNVRYLFKHFHPFMLNVKKLVKRALRILSCKHRKIFKVCLATLEHYAREG